MKTLIIAIVIVVILIALASLYTCCKMASIADRREEEINGIREGNNEGSNSNQ